MYFEFSGSFKNMTYNLIKITKFKSQNHYIACKLIWRDSRKCVEIMQTFIVYKATDNWSKMALNILYLQKGQLLIRIFLNLRHTYFASLVSLLLLYILFFHTSSWYLAPILRNYLKAISESFKTINKLITSFKSTPTLRKALFVLLNHTWIIPSEKFQDNTFCPPMSELQILF